MIERAALHTQPSVYLSNLIPQNFGMIHDHNTRHTSRIPPVRTRTSLYASYFIPSSVQLWNQQPENIKSSYLSLVALWRGQCSRKWAVVSVALHWQNGEFTMFLRNKWWLRDTSFVCFFLFFFLTKAHQITLKTTD
jgi:hypothetical protein